MKYIKVLGLAAIAATALMAFVGASSASATVLRKETPTGLSPAVCPLAQTYGAGTVVKGEASDPVLTNSLENVTCKTSHTEAEVKETGSATSTVVGTITALEFSECATVTTHTPCTVSVENLPYHAEVHWTEGTHNGTFTGTSDGNGNPGALVTCGTILVCKFSTAQAVLSLTGGNPASLLANGIALTPTGGFLGAVCPKQAFWDANYVATNPTNIWVGKEEL